MSIKLLLLPALLLVCFTLPSAEAVPGLVGACKSHNYTTIDIDLKRYAGTWYEQAHSNSFFSGTNCACTRAIYSANADGTVGVANSCRRGDASGAEGGANGTAKVVGPGQLKVSFPSSVGPAGPYDVVMVGEGADYTYAAVVSCDPFPVFGGSNVWILARDPEWIQTNQRDAIKVIVGLSKMGFDLDDFVSTDQEKCWGQKPRVHAGKRLILTQP